MNKYIKAQKSYYQILPGIYEIKDGKFLGFDVDKYSKDFVTKQANTIQELCDVFLVIKNNRCVGVWKDFEALKEYDNDIFEHNYDAVYGAMWTETGLLYVAKMNDKGDLELLWTEN